MDVAAKCPRCGAEFQIQLGSESQVSLLRKEQSEAEADAPLVRLCGACLLQKAGNGAPKQMSSYVRDRLRRSSGV
jgi:hypothetical protein